MDLIVMKFGGTLMGSTEAIKHSASLVAVSVKAGTRVVVVPSAMSGVTDQLIKIASSAEQGQIDFANDEIGFIKKRHLETAVALATREDGLHKLEMMFDSLSQTINGIYLLRELSKRSKDLIVSFGERLSAPLMSAALEQQGIPAHDLTGGQAGMLTNKCARTCEDSNTFNVHIIKDIKKDFGVLIGWWVDAVNIIKARFGNAFVRTRDNNVRYFLTR